MENSIRLPFPPVTKKALLWEKEKGEGGRRECKMMMVVY